MAEAKPITSAPVAGAPSLQACNRPRTTKTSRQPIAPLQRAFEVQHQAFDHRQQQQLLHLGGVKCRMSAEEIAWHNRAHDPALIGPTSPGRAPKHD
jgi:hypothetical protein